MASPRGGKGAGGGPNPSGMAARVLSVSAVAAHVAVGAAAVLGLALLLAAMLVYILVSR